ncbi:MAG: amidohydrolase/deacetylase family metallohydrolase [Gemmatimonadetes bacterium]|nr:amidohydrolase/deacetylase family metallohydrolase [Gemmatimonadota bacterium]
MPTRYDLLVKGGQLQDTPEGLNQDRKDIGIRQGRIESIADEIHEEDAQTVIDASGTIVCPGMIDLHVHVWDGVAHLGIPADPNCVGKGVTTAFDAGSAGADIYPGFQKYVIDVSATRIKSFLHISSQGQLAQDIGELTDIRYANVSKALEACETYKDSIVGIKIRMSTGIVGDNGPEGLKLALEVCEATGLPLMIHPNASPISFEEMMDELRGGDIVTHCYHRSDTGVIDESGRLRSAAKKALDKGIQFDVGHGAGSFSFDVAEAALEQGFPPGTISSDLHKYNVDGPVHSLLETVSKFIYLGLSFEEAIQKVTTDPARAIKMVGDIGALRQGAAADLTLIRIVEGPAEFTDALGEKRTGDLRLEHVSTVKDGRVYAPGMLQ